MYVVICGGAFMYMYMPAEWVSLLDLCDLSFLLTASTPTYRIVIFGSLSEQQRTLTNGSMPLSDGDICDIDVSCSYKCRMYMFCMQANVYALHLCIHWLSGKKLWKQVIPGQLF